MRDVEPRSADLKRQLRQRTLAVLHQRRFLPDLECGRHLIGSERLGRSAWQQLLDEALAGIWNEVEADAESLRERGLRVERVAGLCEWGATWIRVLGAESTASEAAIARVAAAAGCLNLLFCAFDGICDEMPECRRRLFDIVTRERIRRAVDCKGDSPLELFATRPSDNPIVRFCAAVAEQFFRRLRVLGREAGSSHLLVRFRDVLLAAYAAELASLDLTFETEPDESARQTLKVKSASQVCLFLLLARLLPEHERKPVQVAELERLEAAAFLLGEVIWIVDDIADAARDAEVGLWSSVWLEAVADHPGLLATLREGAPTNRLLLELLETRVPEELATALCDRFEGAKRELAGQLGGFERIEAMVRLGVHSWLDELSRPDRGSTVTPGVRSQDPISVIDRAVAFVGTGQLTDGSFLTSVSHSMDFGQRTLAPSVYLPCYIVDSLSRLEGHALADRIVRKAAGWLRSQAEPGGLWRFFGNSYLDPPPDLDDTCCALAALEAAGTPHRSTVLELLRSARTRCGGYETWFDRAVNEATSYPVDLAVNANVAYYLALRGRAVSHLLEYFETATATVPMHGLSRYAVSEMPLLYLLMRAFRRGGAACLDSVVPRIRDHLLETLIGDGWGNDLDTALGLAALVDTGYRGPELARAAARLAATQRADGGWPAWTFCCDFRPTYYGSEELTTALCIEALLKWHALTAERPHHNPPLPPA